MCARMCAYVRVHVCVRVYLTAELGLLLCVLHVSGLREDGVERGGQLLLTRLLVLILTSKKKNTCHSGPPHVNQIHCISIISTTLLSNPPHVT